EGADTRPGDEDRASDTTGLAEAARQISGLIAGDSVPLSRSQNSSVVRLNALQPAPTTDRDVEPITAVHEFSAGGSRGNGEFDEAPTPTPVREPRRDTDEDLTTPREKLVADEPLANAFLAGLPPGKRDAALARGSERSLAENDVA